MINETPALVCSPEAACIIAPPRSRSRVRGMLIKAAHEALRGEYAYCMAVPELTPAGWVIMVWSPRWRCCLGWLGGADVLAAIDKWPVI